MSPERFEHLLTLVGRLIKKKTTNMRTPLSPVERLTITLRLLASGDKQQSLSLTYRHGRTTVCHTIRETCRACWQALKDVYLRPPNSSDNWKKIARGFYDHCEMSE